jgi:hypothetical protein
MFEYRIGRKTETFEDEAALRHHLREYSAWGHDDVDRLLKNLDAHGGQYTHTSGYGLNRHFRRV